MNILAISGSLQSQSSNSALIRHAAAYHDNLDVHVFDRLAELPHFNPELDGDDPPAAVRTLRLMAGAADAILIASPEYAHEMPGSLNPIESMISIARKVTGNVKRWRNGKMALRWTAAGLLDAEKRSRRVKRYRAMVIVRRALHKHHEGLASTREST